jgi:hypothetical protein
MSQKAAPLIFVHVRASIITHIARLFHDETHNPTSGLSTQPNVQLFPKPKVTVTDQTLPEI